MNSHGHSAADYKVSLERARLKYEYREWLSVIVGKMHTPVNYWNDVYHHGRLWFPVIDRPRSFGTSIPIHTLGLRLQGQNIGKLKFGYDLVVGNGMSSNDVTDGSGQKSVTAAVHIKPEKRTRISLSAYRDVIYGNSVGAHAGHSGPFHYNMGEVGYYPVDLDFDLYCFSVYRNKGKWEVLLETSLNRTGLSDSNDPALVGELDTLGTSTNATLFFYAGHKVGKRGRLVRLGGPHRLRGAGPAHQIQPARQIRPGLAVRIQSARQVADPSRAVHGPGRFRDSRRRQMGTEIPNRISVVLMRMWILLLSLLPLGPGCPGGDPHRQQHGTIELDRKPAQGHFRRERSLWAQRETRRRGPARERKRFV